ncbi:MAG: class II glutamine amidotransferase [Desulfurococcaceae archaeon]
MCRLMALTTEGTTEDALSRFMDAFTKSAHRDVYLLKITNGKFSSHDDGWGLAAAGLVRNTPSVAQHRSIEPIFHEYSIRLINLFIRKLVSYKPLYVIMHARKSSASEPYGLEYTHPFMMLSNSGVAWFAHNGGAKKSILAEKMGVFPWIRVDSELLGYYVMNKVLSCGEEDKDLTRCVVDAYIESKEYITEGSALNTVLLILWKNKPRLFISHWVKEPLSDLLREYYAIIAYRGKNTTFAGSISIRDYLPTEFAGDVWILEPGIYELTPEDVFKLADL